MTKFLFELEGKLLAKKRPQILNIAGRDVIVVFSEIFWSYLERINQFEFDHKDYEIFELAYKKYQHRKINDTPLENFIAEEIFTVLKRIHEHGEDVAEDFNETQRQRYIKKKGT